MNVRVTCDEHRPTASVEWIIARPLPDFDLVSVAVPVPRDVDPVLASQGFKDLLDEVRGILEEEMVASGLEIVQLTGAICHDADVCRPGIWLIVREIGTKDTNPISPGARAHLEKCTEIVRTQLALS